VVAVAFFGGWRQALLSIFLAFLSFSSWVFILDMPYPMNTSGMYVGIFSTLLSSILAALVGSRFFRNAAILYKNKQYMSKLKHSAYQDDLTEMPNRRFFMEALPKEINRARREEQSLAVMFLDLDDFKAINDKYGHDRADKVLQEVARRFKIMGRDSDLVARLGGDEFIWLFVHVRDSKNALMLAEKIQRCLKPPVSFLQSLTVRASIGIALFPEHGKDEQSLLHNSDVAMYYAKKKRLGHCLYNKDLHPDGFMTRLE